MSSSISNRALPPNHAGTPVPVVQSSKRVLDPAERVFEVLFGLIMVLTFTGSLSVAEAGRDDVRAMLLAALGCNLAWGIIDAAFYLMGCLAEKGRALLTLQTRLYETDLDVQRGYLIGLTYGQVDFSTFVFNPGSDDTTLVLAVSLDF